MATQDANFIVISYKLSGIVCCKSMVLGIRLQFLRQPGDSYNARPFDNNASL